MVALLQMPNRPRARTLERRSSQRKSIRARALGVRLDHSIQARRRPHVRMTLRDLSLGGMAAISDIPLEYGERVTVSVPPQPGTCGWDAYGRVVRCEPGVVGWRIAVEFDPLPAA